MTIIETAVLSIIVAAATYTIGVWWSDLAVQGRTPHIPVVTAAWDAIYDATTTAAEWVWGRLQRLRGRRTTPPQEPRLTLHVDVIKGETNLDDNTVNFIIVGTLQPHNSELTDRFNSHAMGGMSRGGVVLSRDWGFAQFECDPDTHGSEKDN